MDDSPKRRLEPNSPFRSHEIDLPFRVVDFWSWGFSDLKQNALRGTLAEFLVAQATNAKEPTGHGWDDYDLETPDGTKIEVKCSAYIQSWPQAVPSQINFSRLTGRAWSAETGYAIEASIRADVFVFCIQTTVDRAQYDPLNVDQWEFYVVSGQTLRERGYKTIGLAALRRLCPESVHFAGLQRKVAEVRSRTAL